MDVAVIMLMAIIHDVGHDGKTNAFHVNRRDRLAIRYNDKSVLENYHVSAGFKLLLVNKDSNVLADQAKEQTHIFRKEGIDLVLGTDMSQHFSKLGEFTEAIKRIGQDPDEWKGDESAMYCLRGMTLHTADINNQAKPMWLAQQWSSRCLLEFFVQGDLEKNLGLPVSPLCDRESTDIPTSQIGFIQFIVHPTYELMAGLLPGVARLVDETSTNCTSWHQRKGSTIELKMGDILNETLPFAADYPFSEGDLSEDDGDAGAISHL
jgi:hypothetical protein